MEKWTLVFYGVLMILILNSTELTAQSIDHWESVVLAEDNWRYRVGNSEPPADWLMPAFDDNSWDVGPGGIGYGDDDDNTFIANTISLYLRLQFDITDTAAIESALFHADYDDSFVAYLNGSEIARANITSQFGARPPFDQTADGNHEAELYQGGLPSAFPLNKSLLRQLLKNGSNTLAIQVHNQALNSSDLSSLFFFSLGINNSSQSYRSTPSWFTPPFSSSNLPLMFINTNGQGIPNDFRIVADMGLVDNGPGQRNAFGDPFNAYEGKIAIELRGESSLMFPKNNFSFETQEEDGENRNVSLLGMPEENDWVLHGPYSDKSLLRNVITYYLGRRTGEYAPRTRYCEVILNNQYHGLYILTEKIKRDKNRLDIANLKPEDISGEELSGAYLIQIDRDAPGIDDGWLSSHFPNPFYQYADPDYDELVNEQKNYIRNYITTFESAMQSSNYAATYDDFVDIPSLVNFWIVNEIGKHVDTYRLSFYMYKRKDNNGGKLHFGPLWDFNLGYGNFNYSCDEGPEGWAFDFINTCDAPQVFWFGRLLNIPEVRNAVHCRWDSLRQTVLHSDSILQYIDTQTALLDEAQQRNFNRWPVLNQQIWPNSFVGGSYEAEINFLKDWLTHRLNWMDAQMIGTNDCFTPAHEALPHQTSLQVAPNPFENQLSFRWLEPSSKTAQLYITDALGRQLALIPMEGGKTVRWKQQAAGLYFYRLVENNITISTGKLVGTGK